MQKGRLLSTTRRPIQPPTTETPTTKDGKVNFKCPYVWGFFPHPYDCSKFFACKFDIPILTECPKGFLWDINDRACVEWRWVNCGDRINKYRITTTPRPITDAYTTTQPTTTTTTEVTTTEVPTTKVLGDNLAALFYNMQAPIVVQVAHRNPSPLKFALHW
ncbi:hypothetical protein AVEN_44713-1, partial [Araneus ventricosus]